MTQPQDYDPTAEPEGPLRFITDPAIRAEAEDEGFAHGGVEDVMPHGDGGGLTVLYGDNTRRSWRWGEEE